jgi:ATP phosphoribosyltransferase regulatory subunit
MGIELVASNSKMADLEALVIAMEVLGTCSPEGFNIEIGDVGIFNSLVSRLNTDDNTKENIRMFIEQKNYPGLNDLLDRIGNNSITDALKQLPRLFGGEEVFDKARELFSDDKTQEILSRLQSLYKDICGIKFIGKIIVDLGIVNRLDYYTGIVMKGYSKGCGDAVLSGGRYDKLLSEFGYDVPAIGFALNVDAVSKLILKLKERPKPKNADVLIYAEKGYEMRAAALAFELRAKGQTVEFTFFEDVLEAKKYAQRHKIPKLSIVTGENNANIKY